MRKAYIQMHVSIFLWGFTGVLGRLIELNEGLLVWYRMLITSSLLLLILLATNKLEKFSFRKHYQILLVGICVTIHWLFFYGAIKYSNVSVTLSCLASTALFTSIFEPIVHRNNSSRIKISFIEICFSLLAIIGIYLVFAYQKIYTTGIILALIASAVGAFFTVLNKKLMHEHRPETVTFLEISSGLIFLTALMPLYIYFFPSPKTVPTTNDWIYLVCLSFFCTIIPFNLSLHALKKVSAFTINLSLNLEPLYGILLAFAVFHENKYLNAGFYTGAGLIIISVVLHTLHKLNSSTIKNKSEEYLK